MECAGGEPSQAWWVPDDEFGMLTVGVVGHALILSDARDKDMLSSNAE